MRIGIITHNYPSNRKDRKDAGIFLYDFAHELAKSHDVFVLCPYFEGKKGKYKNVPVSWFDWGGGKEKFGNWSLISPTTPIKFLKLMLNGTKETSKFVKKHDLDFLLAAWALPSGVFAWQANRSLGVPYATWSLGSDLNVFANIPITRQLISFSLKNADVRFANSHKLCSKIKLLSGGKGVFMPAITSFEIKKPKNIKLSSNNLYFLYVGRLEKIKGPDILINTVKTLAESLDNFRVNIIGDGTLEQELKKIVDDHNLGNIINFLGRRGKEDVAGYMAASDCLIIPSRNESLPLVMIEAANVGLPIIASDVGDCKRIIDSYNVGYSFPAEDEKMLLEKMVAVVESGKSFKRDYKKRLKTFANDFTQSEAVRILENNIK